MVLYLRDFKYDQVLVIDTEFDQMQLLQVAGMLFERVQGSDSAFQLSMSFNMYVQEEVGPYAEKYTGLTTKFLKENGLEKKEFVRQFDEIMSDLNMSKSVLVSHGVKNDRKVLKDAGVTFLPENSYCTYNNAKRVLERDSNLKLAEVALEAGFSANNHHNAYHDSLATAVVLSFLLLQK